MNTYTPQQAWQILRARRKLIFKVLGTIVGLTLIGSLLWPKSYRGQASVVVDVASPDPITGLPTVGEMPSAYLATQLDVLMSHNVAVKVVDRLKLNENSELVKLYQSKTGGLGTFRDWAADTLEQNLDVVPSRESSVITISYYARDPQVAAAIANAFADSYIQTDRDIKVENARRQSSWFQEQTGDLRKNVETAQQRLSEYERSHSVVGNAQDRLDIESARMGDITAQLVAAQAQLGDSHARLQQLKGADSQEQLEQLPDILGNSLLQGMKADLTRAEGKLADTSQRLGVSHPQYIQALAEVKELRRRLFGEIGNVKGAIEQTAQISQQRVNEIQGALDQQKARILQLQQEHDAIDVLSRDVQNAQHTYDSAIQRTDSLRLEGRNDQGTIAVLDRSPVPIKAARPRVLLYTAIAFVLGLLLSVSAAFVSERLDRRVRTRLDMEESQDIPLLAEISGLFLPAPKSA